MTNNLNSDYITASPDGDLRSAQIAREAIAVRLDLARYCGWLLHSEAEGEDAAHDALVLALRKAPALRSGTPIRPWIFRIARNRCIDLFRRRKRRADADRDLLQEQVAAVAPDDSRLRMREALLKTMTLARRERQCLLLREVLGDSLTEAAARLAIPVGAVKAALHRARVRVRVGAPGNPDARFLCYLDAFEREDWGRVLDLVLEESHSETISSPSRAATTPMAKAA